MARARLAVGVFALLLVTASAGASAETAQSDGFADVLVGDVVIGEPDQRFPGMRAVAFDADAESVALELDLAVLESHGIDVGGAGIDLPADAVHGASVETATVDDGRVTLVFAPDDSTDAVIQVDEFRLTGLDTTGAEPATELTYDASFSAGEARVRSFDIVDPDRVTPTMSADTFFTAAATHRLSIRDLQAADGAVTIELDVTVLERHGVDIESLAADVTADGAAVVETAVEGGVVTTVVSPAGDTVLFDVHVELRGFDASAVDSDQRVIATDVAYAVAIDGDGADGVTVEPFDVATRPTVHADPPTTSTTVEGHGFGPTVAVAAVVLLALLAARRR